MTKPKPTPLEVADNCVATARAAREQNEAVRANFEAMKAGAAALMAYPADMLPEALCQPHERHNILALRKSIGQLLELVETKQKSIDLLVTGIESSAATIRTMQGMIDSQAEQLEEYRNGRD